MSLTGLLGNTPFWVGPTSLNWDTLAFGTLTGIITFPGVARVSVAIQIDYHKAKAQGQDNAAATLKGRKPRKVNCDVKIWTQDQLNALAFAVASLNLDAAGKSTSPLQLLHPQADIFGITEVVFEGCDALPPNAKDGMLVRVRLLEVLPPVPTNPTPPQQSFSQKGIAGPAPGAGGKV